MLCSKFYFRNCWVVSWDACIFELTCCSTKTPLMEDWIIYIGEEELNFSEYFKQELSIQLLKIFEFYIEEKDVLERYFFALFINFYEMEIIANDDYVHTKIGILSPDSCNRAITIGWKSKCFENKIDIHSRLTKENDIQFFYFTDFPTEELKSYILKKESDKQCGGFQTQIRLELFPDLTMKFVLKTEFSSDEISETNEIVNENIKKHFSNCYVSDFNANQIMLDFQTGSSNFNIDLEQVEIVLVDILSNFRNSNFATKIDQIIVE